MSARTVCHSILEFLSCREGIGPTSTTDLPALEDIRQRRPLPCQIGQRKILLLHEIPGYPDQRGGTVGIWFLDGKPSPPGILNPNDTLSLLLILPWSLGENQHRRLG